MPRDRHPAIARVMRGIGVRSHRLVISWLWNVPRSDRAERIDAPGHDPSVLAGNLADIRRANRWLGGIRLTLRGIERLSRDLRPGDGLTVLDVATGSADIPAAVVAWARRRGLRARVVATDRSHEVLCLAQRAVDGIELAAADARCLPFATDSFDVAMCSLVLHHLSPADAVQMLREMGRVARRGIVVNDLVRTRWSYLSVWILTRTIIRNPLTRHDGPLSVQRAYTREEMVALARRAEIGPVDVAGYLGYRVAMIAGVPP